MSFGTYNRLRLNDIFASLLPPGPAQGLFARVNVTKIGNSILLVADEEIDLDNDGDFNNATQLICLFSLSFLLHAAAIPFALLWIRVQIAF